MKLTEKVKSVVSIMQEGQMSANRISKICGAVEMSLINLKKGKADVKNISLEQAEKIGQFYDKYVKSGKIGSADDGRYKRTSKHSNA